MGQKSKKQARKASARRSVVQPAAGPLEPTVKTAGGATRPSGPEFNPDYSQTIKDLRRIGILAGGFFGLLIILSFFLR